MRWGSHFQVAVKGLTFSDINLLLGDMVRTEQKNIITWLVSPWVRILKWWKKPRFTGRMTKKFLEYKWMWNATQPLSNFGQWCRSYTSKLDCEKFPEQTSPATD